MAGLVPPHSLSGIWCRVEGGREARPSRQRTVAYSDSDSLTGKITLLRQNWPGDRVNLSSACLEWLILPGSCPAIQLHHWLVRAATWLIVITGTGLTSQPLLSSYVATYLHSTQSVSQSGNFLMRNKRLEHHLYLIEPGIVSYRLTQSIKFQTKNQNNSFWLISI